MNSHLFHLQSNVVSYVPEKISLSPTTPMQTPVTPSTPIFEPISTNTFSYNSFNNDFNNTMTAAYNRFENRADTTTGLLVQSSIATFSETKSNSNTSTPPPLLSITPTQSPAKMNLFKNVTSNMLASGSPISSNHSSPSSGSSRYERPGVFNQSLKSHIMKAVADNSALDYHDRSIYGCSNGRENYSGLDAPLAKMMKNLKIITKTKECLAAVKRMSSMKHPLVALDAEGVNLGPNGPMTLLQLATSDEQVYIFDVFSNQSLIVEGGLKDLLESEDIIKVAHDCRNDSAALYYQYGVLLRNVFDTQAAHAVLQLQETGKPVYKVKAVSLNTLCGLNGAPTNPKKDQMKNLYRKDQRFWRRRPLNEDMIFHAAFDVFCLVPTIYNSLKKQLHPESNKLLEELCQEQVLAYIQPDFVKDHKKQRKIDIEVADLKLKLANNNAKQIVLSNREIRLLRYLELTDEERTKIEGSHKVARKLERLRSHGNSNDSGSVHSGSCGQGGDENFSDDSIEEEEEDDDFGFTSDNMENDHTLDSLMESLSSHLSPCHSELRSPDVSANGGTDYHYGNWSPDGSSSNSHVCQCNCHKQVILDQPVNSKCMVTFNSSCQTLSTGDIVITKVFFEDSEASPVEAAKE